MRLISLLIACLLLAGSLPAARLKDLVDIEGVRDNQIIGYGLVVGLARTGDSQQTIFTNQSLTNILERMGVSVASTGDAANLRGGILLLTSLRGADGQVYAVAQGPVVTGGFVAGRGGASQTVNHPTVGRSPNGGTVERAAPSIAPKSVVRLQLRESDFTTAARIVDAVNKKFASPAPPLAHAENSGLISIAIPPEFTSREMEFVAELENLAVEADRPARVVINERTGTIVLGKEVRVAPVAILHGNLTVEVETVETVSQPNPLAQGTTEVVPQTTVGTKEEKARTVILKQGATVEELVRALSAIGSTPRDIIAILQSLRSAGALEAEVEVN